MNIKDIITLVRAGYTKDEINATIAAAEAAEAAPAPIDMPATEAEPAPAASGLPASAPEEDPRIRELQDQVRALQAKVIQLSSVPTAEANKDPIMDIANALINGGIEK